MKKILKIAALVMIIAAAAAACYYFLVKKKECENDDFDDFDDFEEEASDANRSYVNLNGQEEDNGTESDPADDKAAPSLKKTAAAEEDAETEDFFDDTEA